MRHQKKNKKLNKPTDQRIALLRNLSYSLLENERIVTTQTRAKEAQKFIEKLVTISKSDTVSARRQVNATFNNKKAIKNIFEIAKKYKDRNGGYTRIINVGIRKGDNAKLSLLEFIN